MIIYSLNTYLQNDSILQGLIGGTFIIQPYHGEATDTAPFILYEWRPGTFGNDLFMLNDDIIVYTVADTDINRAFLIRKRLLELLNVGNAISTVVDADSQLNWSFLQRSYDVIPKSKDGYHEFSCLFQVGYKSLS